MKCGDPNLFGLQKVGGRVQEYWVAQMGFNYSRHPCELVKLLFLLVEESTSFLDKERVC